MSVGSGQGVQDARDVVAVEEDAAEVVGALDGVDGEAVGQAGLRGGLVGRR
jgi:hypothetical protein